MRTKIVGHAIIRLIFQSQAGENFTIFTRAMIVEDLQGPIYLGQDIFQAKHIFHSLTRDHMHILYKNKRFACPYIKPTRDINTMTVTSEEESDRVSFAASQEQHISPNSRKLISIEANPTQAHSLPGGKESVELVPTSAHNLPEDIKVIPCLNYLSPTFQTKIMVENCGDKKLSLIHI